jgi:glycosyltransferase involved in cell wall biosynthesis
MTFVSLLGCRRAIAVSRYARRHLALLGFLQRKVAVVHHGVDPIFSPGAADDDKPPFLLAVADIYIQKNLHRLIDALVRVRRRVPEIRLLIAGRRIDDEYFREIEKVIDRHALRDHVLFLGERPATELVTLYRSCAAFVFPSTIETFGNPLAEAMACGAPIASSDTAAMPEVVGDAALLFNPLDPAEMADCICRILLDKALARSLAARGLARVTRFSWERTARLTADVLVSAARAGAVACPTDRDPISRLPRD